MEEIAQVYARSLFEVAKEHDKLDVVREQLGEFADALQTQPRAAGVLLLALLLHRGEEGRPAARRSTAPTRPSLNFLELLVEKHRMPVIFRIRREFDALWEEENQLLPRRGHERGRARPRHRRADRRRDRRADRPHGRAHAARVDPDILGGIVLRVGNSILDASIRNRLEQLRKQVAQGER